MSEWVQKFLGDVLNIKHGFAFKGEFFSDNPTQSILLTPGNVGFGGGFKTDKFKYYDGPIPNDYILKEGDVFVTMTDLSKEGDTLGYAAKIPYSASNKFLHNQRLGLVELLTDDIHKGFIYWVLRTSNYQKFIVSSATGTTVRHTSPSRIKEYAFKLPPLPTQKAIAEILSSLDDKIELNNQINQNLEALAQALFKQWFVDFEFPNENGEPYKSSGGEMIDSELGEIPKGWRIDFLTKILNVVYGKNLPTTNLTSFGFPVFGGNGIIGYYSKFHYENPQVLISCRGAASGKINFSKPQSFITNNSLVIEIPDGSNIPYGFLRQWSLNQDFTSFVSGSAQPQITIENLKPLQLLIPSKNILEEFTGSIEPLLIQKEELDRENFELKNLRDTLLPKLISGELEVNESLLESTF